MTGLAPEALLLIRMFAGLAVLPITTQLCLKKLGVVVFNSEWRALITAASCAGLISLALLCVSLKPLSPLLYQLAFVLLVFTTEAFNDDFHA